MAGSGLQNNNSLQRGQLSQHFEGVAAKRLTAVEVNPEKSNQHEFQGIQQLREILGTPAEKVTFPARFVRYGTDTEEREEAEAFVTWSDVRRANPNRAAEFHLYYAAEADPVVHLAKPGDLLLVLKRKNTDTLLILILTAGSTLEQQIIWLFDLPEDQSKSVVLQTVEHDRPIDIRTRYILEELEIEVQGTDENWLDKIIQRFGRTLPTTAAFSAFSRETAGDVSPINDPDGTLLTWMEHEEMLFRTFEKYLVGERLKNGFMDGEGQPDVDGFIGFSLSVQNRRKARVGRALENHLEFLFQQHGLKFIRGAETENRAKPDFLFPGLDEYLDPSFPEDKLFILGVKSTCKDRWRQVLSEAKRLSKRHLLTLEPGISENQTEEMKANNLQLVIPSGIQVTYKTSQQQDLLSLSRFIQLVQD